MLLSALMLATSLTMASAATIAIQPTTSGAATFVSIEGKSPQATPNASPSSCTTPSGRASASA
jgi:hypothetical protein